MCVFPKERAFSIYHWLSRRSVSHTMLMTAGLDSSLACIQDPGAYALILLLWLCACNLSHCCPVNFFFFFFNVFTSPSCLQSCIDSLLPTAVVLPQNHILESHGKFLKKYPGPILDQSIDTDKYWASIFCFKASQEILMCGQTWEPQGYRMMARRVSVALKVLSRPVQIYLFSLIFCLLSDSYLTTCSLDIDFCYSQNIPCYFLPLSFCLYCLLCLKCLLPFLRLVILIIKQPSPTPKENCSATSVQTYRP